MVCLIYYISKSSIVTFPLVIRKFNKEALTDDDIDGHGYDPTIEFM